LQYTIITNTIKRPIKLVEKSLRNSLKQKISPVKVILIDQNDPPLHLPADIVSNPLFEQRCVTHQSVSAARNSAAVPDGAEWIFFCDDDGYPVEDYSVLLEDLIIKNPDTDIFAGSIIRDDNNSYYTLRHKQGGELNTFRNTKLLMGSNFVVRKNVFDELGRFDENFGAGSYWGSGEETDFCWKAFFANKKMIYSDGLKVYHVPPFQESLKEGFSKSFKYGVGKGALVYKWLFKKKKIIVLYELLEMSVVPFILMLRGLFTLKPSLISSNIASLAGRVYGLIKAASKGSGRFTVFLFF